MKTVVNIDGELFEPGQARISVFDRGFLYGDSVYEVVRTYEGIPFVQDRHLDRLERSAAMLDMALPERAWLERQIKRTLEAAGCEESYIRIIVTRGSGPITLDPTLETTPLSVVLVKPYEPFPERMYAHGIRVTIPAIRRTPRSAVDPAIKSGNYLNSVLALGEARRAGFDDALLLDVRGRMTEATSANVFIVRGHQLCTPALETGLLAGVTRGLVLEIAQREGIPAAECELTPDKLFAADEVLLTSTLREVMPVAQIDQHTIGAGRPGALGKRLVALYRQRAIQLVRQKKPNP